MPSTSTTRRSGRTAARLRLVVVAGNTHDRRQRRELLHNRDREKSPAWRIRSAFASLRSIRRAGAGPHAAGGCRRRSRASRRRQVEPGEHGVDELRRRRSAPGRPPAARSPARRRRSAAARASSSMPRVFSAIAATGAGRAISAIRSCSSTSDAQRRHREAWLVVRRTPGPARGRARARAGRCRGTGRA